MLADASNDSFNVVLSREMDWQVRDDVAGELAPSLEFWDMGGL